MKILAIDTVSERLGIAFCNGNRQWETCRQAGLNHDLMLVPQIDRLLKRAGQNLSKVDSIAVTCGPGRFTGIRIAITFAGLLSKALRKPAVGISTLKALAFQAVEKGDRLSPFICSVIPAIREEVYWQIFLCKGDSLPEKVSEPSWGCLSEVRHQLAKIPSNVWVTGPATKKTCRAAAGTNNLRPFPENLWILRPSSVARLGEKELLKGPPEALAPLYIKRAHYANFI